MSEQQATNQNTGSFGQQQINDIFSLLSDFNPVTSGAKAVDQAKRTVESLIAALELFVQSMDNMNQVASRVNRLLDDIEGPMRQVMPHVNGALGAVNKLADMSGALTELSKRLGPLMAFMPQNSKPKDAPAPPTPEAK
jgi:ABC-type transporter Mla subunit MlaD